MTLEQAIDAPPTATRERLDRAARELVGSRCPSCGTYSWPQRAVCHHCGAAGAERAALTTVGELITHTTVWVSRPGLEAPFTLGQVELPEGVVVFSHIRGLEPGDQVPMSVELRVADDSDAVPPFWFEPVRS